MFGVKWEKNNNLAFSAAQQPRTAVGNRKFKGFKSNVNDIKSCLRVLVVEILASFIFNFVVINLRAISVFRTKDVEPATAAMSAGIGQGLAMVIDNDVDVNPAHSLALVCCGYQSITKLPFHW